MAVNETPRGALIIHRGALGDLLCAIPTLRALKRAVADEPLTLLSQYSGGRFLQHCGVVDDVIDMNRADTTPLFGSDCDSRLVAWRGQYAHAVAWVRDPDGALHANLRALGIDEVRVQPPFAASGSRLHHAAYLAATVEDLCPDIAIPGEPLRLPRDDVQTGRQWLREAIGTGGAPVIAVQPGSGSAHKNWPSQAFEAAARELKRRTGCRILEVRGPAEVEVNPGPTLRSSDAAAISLPLPLLAGVAGHCSVWVGNDAGTTHLAAWLGLPTVALFGAASDRTRWAPIGRRATVLDASCGPHADPTPAEILAVSHAVATLLRESVPAE